MCSDPWIVAYDALTFATPFVFSVLILAPDWRADSDSRRHGRGHLHAHPLPTGRCEEQAHCVVSKAGMICGHFCVRAG